jgi:thiol:disulfide interchange protein
MGADIGLFFVVVAVLAFLGYSISQATFKPQPLLRKTFMSWAEDRPGYDQVMRQQQETKLPVLVYIYAPWCPHCKELNEKVIATARVDTYLHRLPHVRIAPDHGVREMQLMRLFGAQGYPSLYLVTPDGHKKTVETYVLTGVPHQKTPGEFIETIDKLLKE